ncbi:hypothetical protein LguiB_018158 [Lonicera macranthoides]
MGWIDRPSARISTVARKQAAYCRSWVKVPKSWTKKEIDELHWVVKIPQKESPLYASYFSTDCVSSGYRVPRQAEWVPCATTNQMVSFSESSWITNGHHPARVSPGVVLFECRVGLYENLFPFFPEEVGKDQLTEGLLFDSYSAPLESRNSSEENRSSRSALFDGLDGIEEGGLRALASYIDEHDNEKAKDSLQDRVFFLKRANAARFGTLQVLLFHSQHQITLHSTINHSARIIT